MLLIGVSERGGRDYAPRVEGTLPPELRGSLYRNGPGLFERGGHRLRHLLDGDGLVQRLSFTDGRVRYQNAFVQTPKFGSERKAGKFLYGTWTTRRPGGFLRNIGGGVSHSQAGVTVYPVHGKVIARDEVGPTFELDPATLETKGSFPVVEAAPSVGFKAHGKLDPVSGEWLTAGQRFGRTMQLHVAVHEPSFRLKSHFAFASPRQVYVHDYFVTRSRIVFILHPCEFSPLPFLAGFRSFTDSLSWNPSVGNLLAVLSRSDGEVRFLDAPASFVWHTLNAFDSGDTIVGDFIGYDEPDHFIGKHAYAHTIMQGRAGLAEAPGRLRRYRIDLARGRVEEEVLDHADHEYPMLDWRVAMRRHRFGYFCSGGRVAFHSGLVRVDYETGDVARFDFGPSTQVGEPVFAPRPGGREDQGWLLSECLDGASRTSFFAVFDAEAVDAGPLARIWLTHHVPISFHGAWQGDI